MNPTDIIQIGGWQQVTPSEVTLLIASVNYTIVHFSNGKKIMVATPLKTLAARFEPYHFFRVHKSHLVNLAFVTKFCNYEKTIEMANHKNIAVARRRMTALKREITLNNRIN
jgi:DNA-binding LytR/AlgR family response regulator